MRTMIVNNSKNNWQSFRGICVYKILIQIWY